MIKEIHQFSLGIDDYSEECQVLDEKEIGTNFSFFLFLFEQFAKINEFLKYYDPFPNFPIIPGVDARRPLGRVAPPPPPKNAARPSSGQSFYNPFQNFGAANNNVPRATNDNYRFPSNPAYMQYSAGIPTQPKASNSQSTRIFASANP